MQGDLLDMQNKSYTFPVMITQEENWTVATDVSSGVASQGKSIPEALKNLKEALELYYEDNPYIPGSEQTKVFLTTLEVQI